MITPPGGTLYSAVYTGLAADGGKHLSHSFEQQPIPLGELAEVRPSHLLVPAISAIALSEKRLMFGYMLNI